MISFGALNLWKLEKQDLGEHYRWANNDSIRRLVGGAPQPRSFTDLEVWFQSLQNDKKQEVFSIKTSDTAFVGWTQLSGIDYFSGSAEVGVVIDEQYWGQGIGHDSLVALVRYAFEDLRLHRLSARILSINIPSIKLFNRIGFKAEGTAREAYFTSGRFLDVEWLGLLSREFECPQPRTKNDEES